VNRKSGSREVAGRYLVKITGGSKLSSVVNERVKGSGQVQGTATAAGEREGIRTEPMGGRAAGFRPA
jgi:hypothetical protein